MERFRIPAATNLSSDKGIRFRWPLDVKHLWLFFWCLSSEYSCSIYSLKHVTCITGFSRFQKALRCRQECRHQESKTKRSAQCSVCAAFPGKLLVCWEIVVLVIAAHQHRWGTVLGRPIRPIELLCFLIQAFCELPKKNHLGREKALWFN